MVLPAQPCPCAAAAAVSAFEYTEDAMLRCAAWLVAGNELPVGMIAMAALNS